MERRRFLQITTVGTVALGLPAAGWWSGHPSTLHHLAHPGLLSLLDERRVREIGARYREVVPREDDLATLTSALQKDDGRPVPLTTSNARRSLDRRVRDDFTRGLTIRLDGWILSLTEARQCALFSLLYA